MGDRARLPGDARSPGYLESGLARRAGERGPRKDEVSPVDGLELVPVGAAVAGGVAEGHPPASLSAASARCRVAASSAPCTGFAAPATRGGEAPGGARPGLATTRSLGDAESMPTSPRERSECTCAHGADRHRLPRGAPLDPMLAGSLPAVPS